MKTLRTSPILAICLALAVAASASAKDEPKQSALKDTLSAVTAAELPAKAAEIVSLAKSREREVTTINTVKTAVGLRPVAAPAIVGAIARAVPDMASLAASVAASEQPKQASAIARAAVAAAPSKVAAIVAAVCRAVPSEYRSIAAVAAQAVPGAEKAILGAVASAIPTLKAPINQVLAAYTGSAPAIASVLDQAEKISEAKPNAPGTVASASPSLSRGPTTGGPFVPATATPGNVTPFSSGNQPPGGRDYAAP